MKNAKYYVCPICHNIVVATGQASINCCGSELTALEPQKASGEHTLNVENIENEWYITSKHPMEKEHYISFVAMATGERINIVKQYPQWDLQTRIFNRGRATLLFYCSEHGLFYQNI